MRSSTGRALVGTKGRPRDCLQITGTHRDRGQSASQEESKFYVRTLPSIGDGVVVEKVAYDLEFAPACRSRCWLLLCPINYILVAQMETSDAIQNGRRIFS